MNTQQQIEWHIGADETDTAAQREVFSRKVADHKVYRSRPWFLYELLVGIALMYGVAVYLIWQQAVQRMAVLEDQVAALQQEIAAHADTELQSVADLLPERYPFETEYLHFEASVSSAEVVHSIAQGIDATYQQFYQDFGVPLPSATDKLKIIVDPVLNPSNGFVAVNSLVVPLPYYAVERYDLTLADALMNEILFRLSQLVFNKALQARKIKPQWLAMTLALKTNLQRLIWALR